MHSVPFPSFGILVAEGLLISHLIVLQLFR